MKGLIKCDFHIHTTFSDGVYTISEIVDLYGQKGFGAIAITDHLCEEHSTIGYLTQRAGYSLKASNFHSYIQEIIKESVRAWDMYKMKVIPGYEITKNSFSNHRSCHLIILGVTDFISADLPVEKILKKAKELGGITIAAHPLHTGELEFQSYYLWDRREELKNLVDLWEINSRKKIYQEVISSKLPIIANSDFHHQKHWASWRTHIKAEPCWESICEGLLQQKIDFWLDP